MIYDLELAGVKKAVKTIRETDPESIALDECVSLVKTHFPVLKKYTAKKYEKNRIYEEASSNYYYMLSLINIKVEELKYSEDGVSANLLTPEDLSSLIYICNELFSFAANSNACISSAGGIVNEICTILYWHTDYFRRYADEIQEDKEDNIAREWATEVLDMLDSFLPQLGEALISQKIFDSYKLATPVTLFHEIVHLLMQYTDQKIAIAHLKDFLNKRSSAENKVLFQADTAAYKHQQSAFYYMLSSAMLIDMPLWMQGEPMPVIEGMNVRATYLQALYFAVMTHNSSLSAFKASHLPYVKERLKPFLPASVDISGLTASQLQELPAFQALLPELKEIASDWNLPTVQYSNSWETVFVKELLNKEEYDRDQQIERDMASFRAQKSMGLAYGIPSSQPASQPVSTVTPSFVLAQT